MITRRNFIAASAATASGPLALGAAEEDRRLPLKAEPRVPILRARPAEDGRLLLISDGPEAPRKLIRPEALERAFGTGTERVLYQPDHWRMIDEGWFMNDDLYEPSDCEGAAFDIWQANYRPEIEAHDLLFALFEDDITGPFGARIAKYGLELSEHPSTPRYATAKLDGAGCLPGLAAEVARRTRWLVIEARVAAREVNG
ncbi:hypothetical protein SuNHUV7_09500 (plasmid) [Pseudoseohaeicola sp. NH-UV-7]|uniref:hypothetical protein n=1 Tax=Sulfitobacter sp. TBRI5 TaxID=2989732 RepID=UPI003A72D3A7